jgi:hypothetical protein
LLAGAAGTSASMRRVTVLALSVCALTWCGGAAASITLAVNAQRPALRVDARGYAEVSFVERGVRRTILVPPRGRVLPGGRVAGRDVSRATRAVAIPFRRVVRRTPDGRLWALQTWRPQRGGPVELRFSRWRGAPTRVELTARPRGRTELLEGRATFGGRAVVGFSPTPEGTPIRLAAMLECFACYGNRGWTWFTGVRTRSGGRFAATVPLAARSPKYRATVPGPNRGATYAPDGAAVVVSSLPA